MKIENIHKAYFLGISGIGMSALALYFKKLGIAVSGYDRTVTPIAKMLIENGISVHFEENINLIPQNIDLVVYTPAISRNNKEFEYLKDRVYNIKKRSEILGLITKGKFTIAVAGTHGKTSITSIISHILSYAGLNILGFIGGIAKNFNSNLVFSKNPGYVVVEADEFDKSFLFLYPDIAVVSAIDPDHLDIYQNKSNVDIAFSQFANQVKPNGILIRNINLTQLDALSTKHASYGVRDLNITMSEALSTKHAFYFADNIRIDDTKYYFDLFYKDARINDIQLLIPGRHNVENAVAAAAVALELGVDPATIKLALQNYKGVVRRFDVRASNTKCIYIDDYAHHPVEITALINAVREFYKGKKITGIFQPHLYSRTRDFADEFANALSLLDELILLDIYPARELPIPGITSEIIFDKVTLNEKHLCSKKDVLPLIDKLILNSQFSKHEVLSTEQNVLLTIGAGDVDTLIEPIENLMLKL